MTTKPKVPSYDNKVLRTHTGLLVTTIAVPSVLLIVGAISTKRCFSLFGIGFFLVSGHTFAFFDAYMRYLTSIDVLKSLDEMALKKMLKMSVVLDMCVAIFFYMLGNQ